MYMRKTRESLDQSHPHLINEWHPDNPIPITSTSKGAMTKYKWICPREHVWEASPCNRVKPSGCPYCSGKLPIPGETDLATINPDLAAEFSDRNPMSANEITSKSGKKVWWTCYKGHEWESTVYNRTNGNGCPHCKNLGASSIEIIMLCSFSRYGEVRHHHKIGSHIVDVFMPGRNLVIEYDGYYWHRNRYEKDASKTLDILEAGFNVIRLREPRLNDLAIEHEGFYQAPVAWAAGIDTFNSSVDALLSDIDLFQ